MKKTLVLSDLHAGRLGSRIQNASHLLPLLRGVDQVIFNGDCIEYCWQSRERAEILTEEIDAVARSVVPEVIWIRGNHDMPIEGVDWYEESGVLYTHGHGFAVIDLDQPDHDAPPPEDLFAQISKKYADLHCRRERILPAWWRLVASCATFVPSGHIGYARAMSLRIWDRIGSFIDRYSANHIHTVLSGHYHFGGCFELPHRVPSVRVYYTGAWIKNTEPLAALIYDPQDGSAPSTHLHGVRAVNGGYELGRRRA